MNAVIEQLTELCHAAVQLKISIESYGVISTIMYVATELNKMSCEKIWCSLG